MYAYSTVNIKPIPKELIYLEMLYFFSNLLALICAKFLKGVGGGNVLRKRFGLGPAHTICEEALLRRVIARERIPH